VTPLIAHGCLGLVYLLQGDLALAIGVLEQSLALSRTSGNRDWGRGSLASLGLASALQGRLAEGRALLEEGLQEDCRTGAHHAYRVVWLSEVCRLEGHGAQAWQHARQALTLAQQLRERGDEALALHQLGAVSASDDRADVAQAEAYYQQALALADALGMRPLQAHCRRGLGTLYARRGQWEQGRTELGAARDLYRAMDMTFWLPQVEAVLAQAEER
jgi:tetratricopeptide (TPR) repeat protein